jgi:hypothetical protein
MFDLMDAVLSMKMDVYRQIDFQDPNTGAIKKEWMFYKTIDCHAKGVISNSATSRSSDRQEFGSRYKNEQMIQVRTSERVTSREKVKGIRDSDGNQIWLELDYPTDTPTVFEVVGTTPMTDPLGRVIGYNSSMMRSENQQIG